MWLDYIDPRKWSSRYLGWYSDCVLLLPDWLKQIIVFMEAMISRFIFPMAALSLSTATVKLSALFLTFNRERAGVLCRDGGEWKAGVASKHAGS
jgi:hypothetical protein